jgi:hypothetical protein
MVKQKIPATNPAPKPGKYNPAQRLTEAELADYARRMAVLNREIGKHQAAIFELRNETNRLLHEITVHSDLEGISTGICGLCGFAVHEGECLDA